tara:strand:+ start:230 stop:1024 length:795 start_codon:yes stop_codon:yes gene_type:complete
MGILNLTPDSFYDGGKYIKPKDIINRVNIMIKEGVDIVDIGAFSSRPGAKSISLKEEEKRLFPTLINIRKLFPELIISIDTYRYQIAEQAIKYGANIINDIYAEKYQKEMFNIIQKYDTPYILMHMAGNPENMQNNINYSNFHKEIMSFFVKKIQILNKLNFNKIIIDPGFGFGKTLNQNYELINMISEMTKLKYPVLVGVSRKSMISQGLQINTEATLPGTIAANTICLMQGAKIIRVHDIKAGKETIGMIKLVRENNSKFNI